MTRAGWRGAGRLVSGAALALSLCARAGYAQRMTEPRPPEDEITIDAESLSYDKKTDTVSAEGDVVIRRGESVLRADQVQLDRRTNEAQAIGDSTLTNPEAEIRASSMWLDLDDETGEMTDASIYSERLGYTLSGQRIEKRAGQSYRIENGKFTTCSCGERRPEWSIAGDSVDVSLNGYGYVEGGKFLVLDYPIMWLPKAVLPINRDRQSGLLFPRIGFSNRRGFQLLQPFYWAISKSQDATVSLDVETAQRIGLITDYRYALSTRTYGMLQVGYFNEAIRNQSTAIRTAPGINPVAPENRWGIVGNHTQPLGPAELYADVLLVGDDLFLREMNTFTANERQQVALRTLPFTTSRIALLEKWSRAVVEAQGIYYQNLVGPTVQEPNGTLDQEQSLVIQRVPDVQLFAQKLLPWNVMSDLDGSVTNFARGTGLTGFRGDMRPSAELRLPLGPSVFASLHGAFRETAYGLTQNTMQNGFTGEDPAKGEIILPSTSSRQIFELSGDVSTQLSRVYDFPYFGFDKVKHTIEPLVKYLYIPPVNQDDLPVFDGIDRINKRSLFTYGVMSRLVAREATDSPEKHGDVRPLAEVSAVQSYDFLRQIPPTTRLDDVSGEPIDPQPGDHFSDIDFAAAIHPTAITTVDGTATYNPEENRLSSASAGIHFREPHRVFGQDIQPRLLTRATVNIQYRFITDNIVQLLDTTLALPVTDRIAGLYTMRYDINVGSFLENYVGVRVLSSCDCWSLNLGFTQTRNPNEVQVHAQFTLAGLGNSKIGGLRDY